MLALTTIPNGWQGTAATIKQMWKLVDNAKRDWDFIRLATLIVRHCPQKDYRAEAKAIFDYCLRNLKYVRDPRGIEMIESVWRVLERKAGDCDSTSVLVSALMQCVGIRTAFATICGNAAHPTEFSHVFTVCEIGGQWLAADLVPKNARFGYEPPGFYKKIWEE